jgi:hypothetical protein
MQRSLVACLLGFLAAAAFASPVITEAQGSWGSPSGHGFDANTVVQVVGKAVQRSTTQRQGPSTLQFETKTETFTVVLAPEWFLTELHADIRIGDRLAVEGSKMMDRGGNLHLIASRIVNKRTGVALRLRDDAGRPLWMGGPHTGYMPR